ncbi:MAG: CYTH domain-containing protein [Candidatus Kerfeldbacteria bacterium]|nr:CYTH domain-containing protein [Candidatus Kerfeldbacteria bacterium]
MSERSETPFAPIPERGRDAESVPREIEVKIVNLGDPQAFLQRIVDAGGELVVDRRLLHDEDFKLPKDPSAISRPEQFPVAKAAVQDAEQLKAVLAYLGVSVAEENDDAIVFRNPAEPVTRTVRIRQDGGAVILTVKDKRTKGVAIDDRAEMEVPFTDAGASASVVAQTGYVPKSVKEKYRTTYALGGAHVELNEGPEAPPWAEVEGLDEQTVRDTVNRLGYLPEETAAISDTTYYRSHGIPEERIRSMVFEERDTTT